ncbi:MAG: hypothetical protein KC636_35495, partial [Myxococcales bacterium]|nr:hypothetical protein [Myxococcales bacterium]
ALTSVMAERGLVRAEDSGCTAYWDGSRRDAYKVASRLDLIWHAGFTGAPRAVALAHCARHRCQPLRSTEAYPEPDFADLSDHCPVVVDLAGSR